MTDSIDLDAMDVEDEETEANYGDWIWRDEGDPEDEPDSPWDDGGGRRSIDGAESAGRADRDDEPEADPPDDSNGETTGVDDPETGAAGEASSDRQPAPSVPKTSRGPVGVPEQSGGAGAGSSAASASSASSDGSNSDAAGPHGGDADDMTMALTYDAIKRVEDPQYVIADARGWADWIGIVGDVSTPVIQQFQRNAGIDVDFFGGSDTGPAERLADIGRRSMFYAERMVVVGLEDDAWIADAADWEFVPLAEAADKAGWELE